MLDDATGPGVAFVDAVAFFPGVARRPGTPGSLFLLEAYVRIGALSVEVDERDKEGPVFDIGGVGTDVDLMLVAVAFDVDEVVAGVNTC